MKQRLAARQGRRGEVDRGDRHHLEAERGIRRVHVAVGVGQQRFGGRGVGLPGRQEIGRSHLRQHVGLLRRGRAGRKLLEGHARRERRDEHHHVAELAAADELAVDHDVLAESGIARGVEIQELQLHVGAQRVDRVNHRPGERTGEIDRARQGVKNRHDRLAQGHRALRRGGQQQALGLHIARGVDGQRQHLRRVDAAARVTAVDQQARLDRAAAGD